ncbi:hypothetical protein Zmor_016752 [Zophobas morio]|uniref:Dynein light chain n=1 Tax=Zophobas morio TaxID=2755281 RepID=A0AA38I3W8_9CUCU|nr:hypothetical protein Zmor_016752 [Zophobas morio]
MAELVARASVRIRDLNASYKRSSNKQHKTDKMTDRKAVIKNADMSEDMQQDAVDCATQAIEKYNIEKVTKTASRHAKPGG